MRSRHMVVGSCAVIGLVASLTTFGLPARAATGNPSPIISGKILDSGGVPFPDGTRVDLYALPTSSQMDSLDEGDSIAGSEVANTNIGGGNGTYYLSLENTSVLNPYVDPDSRIVNLEVLAESSSGAIAQYDFTRLVTARTGNRPLVGSGDGVDGTGADTSPETDDGSAVQGSNITALSSTSTPAAKASSTDAQNASTVVPLTEDCKTTLIKKYSAIPTVVGATYSLTSDGGQGFTYTNGSTSNIGVAFSLKAGSGFKLSGSKNIKGSSSSSNTYGQEKGVKAYRYQQNFNYEKTRLDCADFPGGSRSLVDYQVDATSYSGPNVRKTTTAPTATHCNSKLDYNSTFTQDSSTATTYTAGADLSVATDSGVGSGTLSLSTESGYQSSVSAKFWNNSTSKAHSLCGTAGDAGENSKPGRIVLK